MLLKICFEILRSDFLLNEFPCLLITKKSKAGVAIIQVKGTQNVNPSMVRDLKGTIKSQNPDFGILVPLRKPTHGMIPEAVKEGYTESKKKIPKI